MLSGYRISVALVLLVGVAVGSGAVGSYLSADNVQFTKSTADRLLDLEDELAQLGEEQKQLYEELHSLVRNANDRIDHIHKYNTLLVEDEVHGFKSRLEFERIVYELAVTQSLSAIQTRYLIALDGDGINIQHAQEIFDRSKESVRQIKELFQTEKNYAQEKGNNDR